MKQIPSYSRPKTSLGRSAVNTSGQNAAKTAKARGKVHKTPAKAQNSAINKNINKNSRVNSQSSQKGTPNPTIAVTDYDDKPGYKPMTSQLAFKGKMHEFAGVMNPFKPASDVKVKQNMESSLNNPAGRVAGTMTGQTTKAGIETGINQLQDNMSAGDGAKIDKTRQTSIEGRASLSMADAVAPGVTVASGVHIGPSAWISANYTHTKTNALSMQKMDDNTSNVQGRNQTSHQGTIGAFGGAKVGVEAGPMTFGPLSGVTGTVGVNRTTTFTSTLAPEQKAGAEFAKFAENNGKTDYSGEQWQGNSVEKKTTIPASLVGEATLTGTTPYYGDNDRMANTGALSVIAGWQSDDLKHAKDTIKFGVQASGQLYSDGFLKANDDASSGDVSRVDFQRPTEHAIDIPVGKSDDGVLHGSRWNNPFGPNISKLDKELGPGMADFSIQEFRNQFGDNVNQRDMTFHTQTLDDGRVRVSGQLNPKIADGYNAAVPGFRHSNTVNGEMDLSRTLFETAVPGDKSKE